MVKHKRITSLILITTAISNLFVNNIFIPNYTKVVAAKRKTLSRKKFTLEEDNKIKNFVQIYGETSWEKCAKLLPERSAKNIKCRWNNVLKPVDDSYLTKEEKKKLVEAVSIEGTHWITITEKYFGNRRTPKRLKDAYSCIKRHRRENLKLSTPLIPKNSLDILENPLDLYRFDDFDLTSIENLSNTTYFLDAQNSNSETKELKIKERSRKKITPEEDAVIEKFVQENGTNKWKECAKLLPGRSQSVIRNRWNNFLSPEKIDDSELNSEEKKILLKAYAICGPKWTYINKKCFESKKDPSRLRDEYNSIVNQIQKNQI